MDYSIILAASVVLLAALVAVCSANERKLKRESNKWRRAYEAASLNWDASIKAAETCEKEKAAAELEAERARKECAMHEKERRQLEEKILHLKEEYEAQAARADELVRREMENFLGYNGTERGQKELNDDTDG